MPHGLICGAAYFLFGSQRSENLLRLWMGDVFLVSGKGPGA